MERIALLATAPDGGFPTDPVAGLELRAAGGGLLLQARTAGDVLLGSWLQGGDGAAAADAAGLVDWSLSVDSTIARAHQHATNTTRLTGGWIELQESAGRAA